MDAFSKGHCFARRAQKEARLVTVRCIGFPAAASVPAAASDTLRAQTNSSFIRPDYRSKFRSTSTPVKNPDDSRKMRACRVGQMFSLDFTQMGRGRTRQRTVKDVLQQESGFGNRRSGS